MLNKSHSSKQGFTLVEIMIVVAIIALLASVAMPSFMRARKRSQATAVKEELRLLDAAFDQILIEKSLSAETLVYSGDYGWPDIAAYLKKGTRLEQATSASNPTDTVGNYIGMTVSDSNVHMVLSPDTYAAMSDVVDDAFWAPYTTNY